MIQFVYVQSVCFRWHWLRHMNLVCFGFERRGFRKSIPHWNEWTMTCQASFTKIQMNQPIKSAVVIFFCFCFPDKSQINRSKCIRIENDIHCSVFLFHYNFVIRMLCACVFWIELQNNEQKKNKYITENINKNNEFINIALTFSYRTRLIWTVKKTGQNIQRFLTDISFFVLMIKTGKWQILQSVHAISAACFK